MLDSKHRCRFAPLLHPADSYPLSFYSLCPAGFAPPTAFAVPTFIQRQRTTRSFVFPGTTSPICDPHTTLNASCAVLLLPTTSLYRVDPHAALSASGIVSLLAMSFLYPVDPFTVCARPALHHIVAILPVCCLI